MNNKSIDTIGLSVRSSNALRRAGIHTVEDLLACTQESLTKIRNLGQKSVTEILEKIQEYRLLMEQPPTAPELPAPVPCSADCRQELILTYLRQQETSISELELLSTKAYNLLLFNGFDQLHQIAFQPVEALLEIPRMDNQTAEEIQRHTQRYIREHSDTILAAAQAPAAAQPDLLQMRHNPQYQPIILDYARANDMLIEQTSLSNRPKNQLRKNGYTRLSDILFLTDEELRRIPAMGAASVAQVSEKIREYFSEHQARILAACGGDTTVIWDDSAIRAQILTLYQDAPFAGFNLREFTDRLEVARHIPLERLKQIIGGMIADGLLEYVDYRCYRIYIKFEAYLERCTLLSERSLECIRLRLQGETLESIAQLYGLTRERVRQILKRDGEKIRVWYISQTGMQFFDEDYYRYLYETYTFDKKDADTWLGIPAHVWNYLDIMDVRRGKKDLSLALEDTHNLGAGLRQKIKNYLHRSQIYVDGRWVEKKRSELERVVIEKFCTEDTDYRDFPKIYNDFLTQEEIPYDEELYYTDTIFRYRKNVLSEARFLLWKQNEQLRFYDIDGRDYTELLDTLNLESYENIELSTQKFMEDYPEVMEKYDIRDRYELHNLLRKTVPEGSMHDFHCCRMPDIRFGTFDREKAIWDLIVANSPISSADLCALIQKEYGYDAGVTLGYYTASFSPYCHRGIYSVNYKTMPPENQEILRAALTEDFYYIDEIRTVYQSLFPGADPEEVNPFSLKSMGLNVLTRYVLQNHPSLEAYFTHLLTKSDITQLRPLQARYVYVQMFHQTLLEMKRNLDIIEFEPHVVIPFHRLAQAGITKEMLYDFCNQVFTFVAEGEYFSIQSLKQDGFDSPLFDLGFNDWFYGSVLLSDERFAYGTMYANLVLCRGSSGISIKSFAMNRIRAHGSIDVFDLAAEFTDRFGCKPTDPRDLIYQVQDTAIYYDRILDRLYANAELYYRELDESEDF